MLQKSLDRADEHGGDSNARVHAASRRHAGGGAGGRGWVLMMVSSPRFVGFHPLF